MLLQRRTMLHLMAAAIAVTPVALSGTALAQDGVRDDLVVGFSSDALTLLPNTVGDSVTWSYTHNVVYEPLVTRDAEGAYVPVLATEWSTVDDITWEFKLREGVTFQNGDAFDAEAVKFSIDYILDTANNSVFAARIPAVTGAEVVDANTVRILTSKPFPELLDNLVNIMVLDPDYIIENGRDFAASNPNGTGPYGLAKWEVGQYVELAARDDYWGEAPAIRKVTFRTIPEFSARLSAFLAGEIDLFSNVPVDSIARVEAAQGAKVLTAPTARYIYLLLNTFFEGPVQDVRVRQALNYAIDQSEIIAAVLNGYGEELPGLFAPQLSVYEATEGYGYDPEKAKVLLAEAGIDPATLRLHLDTPNGRYPQDSYVAQAIAAQLARIGVTVDVQTREWGDFLNTVKGKQAQDLFLMGWGPNFEPQALVIGLFSEGATYSGHYDPETEALIQEAVSLFDPEARKAAYGKLQEQFQSQAIAVPLWVQTDVYAVAEKLNFTPRLDQNIVPQDISWAP